MVARARARHPEITFEVGDAIAPPADLAAARADAVICDRLCHSVLDVKALLLGLKRRLAPDGRIYLTAFNYLWEVPGAPGGAGGLKRPAPTANWLSDTDFREPVRHRRAGGGARTRTGCCCRSMCRSSATALNRYLGARAGA